MCVHVYRNSPCTQKRWATWRWPYLVLSGSSIKRDSLWNTRYICACMCGRVMYVQCKAFVNLYKYWMSVWLENEYLLTYVFQEISILALFCGYYTGYASYCCCCCCCCYCCCCYFVPSFCNRRVAKWQDIQRHRTLYFCLHPARRLRLGLLCVRM